MKFNKDKFIKGFKDIYPYIICIILVILVRTFIITPITVNGTSMYSTLNNGDVMILNKIGLKFNELKRFDIVVIETNEEPLIKRIIGLPGETIKYVVNDNKGTLYINGKKVDETFISDSTKSKTCYENTDICENVVKIPNNKYYVMGDNRSNSVDSRIIGLINKDQIKGTANLILYPFSDFGLVK